MIKGFNIYSHFSKLIIIVPYSFFITWPCYVVIFISEVSISRFGVSLKGYLVHL